MALSEIDLPERIREWLQQAGLDSLQAILVSSADTLRSVNLTDEDIDMVKLRCAAHLVADKFLPASEVKQQFLSTGCKVLDERLGGGFIRKGIIEIAGESGTGKTQLCLQAALSVQLPPAEGGARAGAVYICTEDTFPSKRLQQLLQLWPGAKHLAEGVTATLSDNIFIEHIPDSESLRNCICVRLPNFLLQRCIGLIVVDSIAGPFRADYDLEQGAVTRAQDLRSIGHQLHVLSGIHNLAVICVNQVTAVPGEAGDVAVPALGLAWANMVNTRLQLHRSGGLLNHPTDAKMPVAERLLEVVFSPYLPSEYHPFVVTESGVQGLVKQDI